MFVKSLLLFIVVIGLATSVSGCGRGDQSPSSPGEATAASGATHENLQITNWGPQRTPAGVVFNAQPDGNAALWIRMNQSLDGAMATIDFNGHQLTATVQGELVTAIVPASLYAASGTYPLHVSVKHGVSMLQSNNVQFVVE